MAVLRVHGEGAPRVARMVEGLLEEFRARGYTLEGEVPDLVFNLIRKEEPKPYRRRNQGTFVVSFLELEAFPENPIQALSRPFTPIWSAPSPISSWPTSRAKGPQAGPPLGGRHRRGKPGPLPPSGAFSP